MYKKYNLMHIAYIVHSTNILYTARSQYASECMLLFAFFFQKPLDID